MIAGLESGAEFTAEITRLAQARGMDLAIGSNFHTYAKIIANNRPEQPLSAPFDVTKQPISAQNGFWITGWDAGGRLVHTQAMRRYRLRTNLAEHLQADFRAFPPAGVDLDLAASHYVPGPGARLIRGTVCYHGEAWLKPGASSFRGSGIAGVLARLAMAHAALRWSPDFLFGFMPEHHAYRGLIEREGYMHSDPGAMFWHLRHQPEILRGHMVWMGRADISHMLGIPPADLLHDRR